MVIFALLLKHREQAGHKRGGRVWFEFIVWLASIKRTVFKFQEPRRKMNYFQSKSLFSKQELIFLRRSLTRLFSFSRSVSFPVLFKDKEDFLCSGQQAILERRDKWQLSHSQITKEDAQKRLQSWRRITRSRTSFLL